jgi:predicted ATPase
MLERLSFTNFKTWAAADLACGRVTGLFGTNSSGKTSLLQFLLMLKQTKEATDRALSLELNGSFVELGTILDVIHQHDETKRITFNMELAVGPKLGQIVFLGDPTSRKAKSSIATGSTLRVAADIDVHRKAPRARHLEYRLGDFSLSLSAAGEKERDFDLKVDTPDHRFRLTRTPGRPWRLPGPVKSYAFPDEARTYYQNAGFLSDLEAAYEAAIDRVFYLGPLREYPKRDYLWARSRPTDVGQNGVRAIDAILAATEAGERRNLKAKGKLLPFQEMIAHWLREMGLLHSFKVEEIAEGSNRWQARVVTRPGGSEVLLTDVGFGVSQVLPVITLLQYVPEGSTVILEQPEIHLHPLAQAGLADVIISAATHRRVQVILESHSEHLLLRLQRRIAEEAIPATDVKLYFCDAPQGVSTLTPLEVDLLGRVTNWPPKFMGDAFGETAQAELARIKRMKAAAE